MKSTPPLTEFSNIPPPGIRYLHAHDAAELIAFRLVGLIYEIRPDEILITSVMDLRRDPVTWKDLL